MCTAPSGVRKVVFRNAFRPALGRVCSGVSSAVRTYLPRGQPRATATAPHVWASRTTLPTIQRRAPHAEGWGVRWSAALQCLSAPVRKLCIYIPMYVQYRYFKVNSLWFLKTSLLILRVLFLNMSSSCISSWGLSRFLPSTHFFPKPDIFPVYFWKLPHQFNFFSGSFSLELFMDMPTSLPSFCILNHLDGSPKAFLILRFRGFRQAAWRLFRFYPLIIQCLGISKSRDVCWVIIWGRISFCSSVWPKTLHVDNTGFSQTHRHPPASDT